MVHFIIWQLLMKNLALALCEAVASFDENIIFLGLSNSAMNEAAKKKA